MSGLAIHLPYYATGLRADQLSDALDELTPKLLRLGALEVRVYRSKDDAYKFLQVIVVAGKPDWTLLWNSEAFIDFRTISTALYQKPLAYVMHEVVSAGTGAGVTDPLAVDPYEVPQQNEAAASAPVAESSPGLSA